MKPLLVTITVVLGLLGAGRLPADALLVIREPWIREAPPTSDVLAGYMIIDNTGERSVEITAITSPDFAHTELHQTLVEDGIARMKPVGILAIPAGSSRILEPGGMHLMLFNPGRVLHAGDTVTLVIRRRDGKPVTVTAPVLRNIGSAASHQHHH